MCREECGSGAPIRPPGRVGRTPWCRQGRSGGTHAGSHNNSGWHAAGLGARLTQGVAHASAYGSGCGMLMVAGACSFGGHAATPVTQGTTCRICGSHGVEQEARQVTHTPREDGSFKRAVQHAPTQGCPVPVVDAARLRDRWQARTGESTVVMCALGQLMARLVGHQAFLGKIWSRLRDS